MSESYTKFNPLEYLTTEEQIESYIAVAKEVNDPIIHEQACEVVERAKRKIIRTGSAIKVFVPVLKNQDDEKGAQSVCAPGGSVTFRST